MAKSLDEKKALDRAQWLCSQQEKCTEDIKRKLTQWGVDPEKILAILGSLIDDGFIDEKRYALTFARDKARFNKWGSKKIEMALRAKRIPQENIQQAISEVESFLGKDTLSDLLDKKLRTLKYKDRYDLKSKLLRFGVSRGFEYGDVLDVVEQLLSTIDFD